MKTKLLIAFSMIAMLVVGFFIGQYRANRIWTPYVEHYFVYLHAANDSDAYMRILTQLHNNNQKEAEEILETLLDGSLVTFSSYHVIPREDFVVRTIQNAHDYRTKYPWAGSASYPELNETVKKVLSSATSK